MSMRSPLESTDSGVGSHRPTTKELGLDWGAGIRRGPEIAMPCVTGWFEVRGSQQVKYPSGVTRPKGSRLVLVAENIGAGLLGTAPAVPVQHNDRENAHNGADNRSAECGAGE